MVKLGKMLRETLLHRRVGERDASPLRVGGGDTVQRANRAAAANRLPGEDNLSALTGQPGQGWARSEYGRYMATSPSVYAAVKLRADALTRPPLRGGGFTRTPALSRQGGGGPSTGSG
ncbi:MAG: hypothetical protein J4G13_13405 [Dehalococcoidia bacterium]|nr:hypothetical protein [Dehalococcoidia bacterium]